MSRLVTSFLFVLATCAMMPLSTQAQKTQTITLEDAKRIAARKNLSVRKAENEVEAQSASTATEWSDFLPDLDLYLSPSQTYGSSFDQATGELSQKQVRRAYGQAQAELKLFDGFANFASLKEARRSLGAEEHALSRTRQDAVFEAAERFLTILKNQEQVSVQQENLEARREQLREIEALEKVGRKPVSDVYQQRATVAEAERALLQARRDLRLSRVRLKQTLDLSSEGMYEFEASATETATPAPKTYEVERLLQGAYDSRADLKAQRARIAAADQSVSVAKAGYWPAVSVTASVGSRYTSSLSAVNISDQLLNVNRQESFGMEVSIPLFSWFETHGEVNKAEAKRRNEALELQNLRKKIRMGVKQAYLDYQAAQKAVEVSRQQKIAAKKALDAAQKRYRLGAARLVELSETRSSYVEAASGLAQARYDLRIQQKQIEYRRGTLRIGR